MTEPNPTYEANVTGWTTPPGGRASATWTPAMHNFRTGETAVWDDPLPAVAGDTIGFRSDSWMVVLIHADGSEDNDPPTRIGGRELWESTRPVCDDELEVAPATT